MVRAVVALAIMLSIQTPGRAAELLVESDGSRIYATATRDLKGYWIGCTIRDDVDLKAQIVPYVGSVVFSIPSAQRRSGDEYVCSVWQRRIDRCGCAHCKRNGYHLEGRLATYKGRIPTQSVCQAIDACRPTKAVGTNWELWYKQNNVQINALLSFFGSAAELVYPFVSSVGGTGVSPMPVLTRNPCDAVPFFVTCEQNASVTQPTLIIGDQVIFGDREYINRRKSL
jgi:hypothetical protein